MVIMVIIGVLLDVEAHVVSKLAGAPLRKHSQLAAKWFVTGCGVSRGVCKSPVTSFETPTPRPAPTAASTYLHAPW